MASEQSNVPVAGIVAVLLVLTSALIPKDGPLLSSRPGGISLEQGTAQLSNVQDVDARLWQDPFDAVQRHRKDQGKTAASAGEAVRGATPADHHRADSIARQISEILPKRSSGDPSDSQKEPRAAVLAAMVFGGPYPEDVEHRRRMRYATLSALKVSGYFPDDAEHVGFIELTEDERRIAANQPPLPTIIPYEWFTADSSPSRPLPPRLLVLWLDELAFQQSPLQRLDAALCRVLGARSPSSAHACPGEKRPDSLQLIVLGPVGSNSLEAMVNELKSEGQSPRPTIPWLTGAAIYSPTTTTSALSLTTTSAKVMTSEPEAEEQLRQLFMAKGEDISLLRVSVPDTIVMLELVRELSFRGIDLVPPSDATDCGKVDHVALISEWDTFYGRSLPSAFDAAIRGGNGAAEAAGGRPRQCDNVHRYSYMRGLDGTLYPSSASANGDKADKDRGKPSAAEDKRERAEGDGQIDYLRRLATRLRQEDRARQHEGHGRIRAIGVLGSDVYDKLMILQALRSDFPDAVFFTTDLDARLVQPGEFARTRNLVVASGYGLQLHPQLQADIPPFRNVDQTATFLTTQLAVDRLAQTMRAGLWEAIPGKAARKADKATEVAQHALLGWRKSASVFEIGRTGAVELNRAGSRDECKDIGHCKNPRHVSTGYYAQHMRPGLGWMAPFVAVLGFVLLLLSSWTTRSVMQRVAAGFGRCLSRRRPLFCLAVVAALGVGTLAVYALRHAFGRDDTEPFALLEGVSVWPTELIRLLALAIAIQGLVYVGRRLGAARRTLTERFFAPQAAELKRVRARWVHVVSWHGLRRIFAGGRRPSESTPAFDPEPAWHEHMFQSSSAARIVRVALMTVVFLALGSVLVQGLFRPPFVPYRGAWTAIIDQALMWPVVILVLTMLFAIVDEIRLCDKFSSGLARVSLTAWSEATRARFRTEREVPDEMLGRWVDVRLIADWTAEVAPLVYYPAVVIVLMLVSRSTLFDAWDMPVGLLLVFALSAVYTLACALTLRRVAERTRTGCLDSLGSGIFRATGELDANRALLERLKLLRQEVESIRRGAFLPFTQQPVVRAIFFAISSGAGLVVTQYLVTR